MLKHGFFYDSSMMGNDYMPYRVRQGDRIELERPAVFGRPDAADRDADQLDARRLPAFRVHAHEGMGPAGLMNANLVVENWINDYLYMTQNLEWGILSYTFHPYVIGRGHRMMALDKLLLTLTEQARNS
jgi:hypothetical protein